MAILLRFDVYAGTSVLSSVNGPTICLEPVCDASDDV